MSAKDVLKTIGDTLNTVGRALTDGSIIYMIIRKNGPQQRPGNPGIETLITAQHNMRRNTLFRIGTSTHARENPTSSTQSLIRSTSQTREDPV